MGSSDLKKQINQNRSQKELFLIIDTLRPIDEIFTLFSSSSYSLSLKCFPRKSHLYLRSSFFLSIRKVIFRFFFEYFFLLQFDCHTMKTIISVFLLFSFISLGFAGSESEISDTTKRPENGTNFQFQQPEKVKINLLELVSGVGKAIHLMLNQNSNSSLLLNQRSSSIVSDAPVAPINGSLTSSASTIIGSTDTRAAREKEENSKRAEELRIEIARRTAQLQKIVGSAIEIMRDRGDVMVRRILEHLNTRLDQARTNADKILKEPATSEMAVRTLNTINQGLNGVNQMIHNVLNRVNIRINVDLKKPNGENEKVKEN